MSQQLDLYPPFTASHLQELVDFIRTVPGGVAHSKKVAFKTGLKNRDKFLGKPTCVICGWAAYGDDMRYGHIINPSDIATWTFLKQTGWIPTDVRALPKDEPRNGLLMCFIHGQAFYDLRFYIRYVPTTKRYIFAHYESCGDICALKYYHNKAVGLDIEDIHAPLPLLFLVHEFMVRGKNFHQPTSDMQVSVGWQKWLIKKGVVDEKDDGSFSFKREANSAESDLAM